MKTHFRGVIWPRQTTKIAPVQGPQGPLYRYAIIGLLITDKPIEKYHGGDEYPLDGCADILPDALQCIPLGEAACALGDATSVLCGLKYEIRPKEGEPKPRNRKRKLV